MAQTDDVHITPRETKNTDANRVPRPQIPAASPTLRCGPTPSRKKEVDLVLVPVTITDPMNRLVTGLEKDNFLLTDNGQPQQIGTSPAKMRPFRWGSSSTSAAPWPTRSTSPRQAVVEFFRTANPQDQCFLVTFSEKPEVLVDYTSSVEDIQNKLVYAIPKGRTALLDAIYLGMDRMRKAHYERKALLIISDGGDNHSRYTEGEIKSMVREADVQIYGVGLFDFQAKTPEVWDAPELLNEITEATGGRTFVIQSPNELADVATKIGIELRNQYVLGYRPTNPAHDGKWRKIKVKLNPPKGLLPLLGVIPDRRNHTPPILKLTPHEHLVLRVAGTSPG